MRKIFLVLMVCVLLVGCGSLKPKVDIDLFEMIEVVIEGIHYTTNNTVVVEYLDVELTDKDYINQFLSSIEFEITKTPILKNGDIITVTAIFDEKEAKKINLNILNVAKYYEVTDLTELPYKIVPQTIAEIPNLEELEQIIHDDIYEAFEAHMQKGYAENWVEPYKLYYTVKEADSSNGYNSSGTLYVMYRYVRWSHLCRSESTHYSGCKYEHYYATYQGIENIYLTLDTDGNYVMSNYNLIYDNSKITMFSSTPHTNTLKYYESLFEGPYSKIIWEIEER